MKQRIPTLDEFTTNIVNERESLKIDNAEFVLQPYENYSIIFIPKSSKDLDIIGDDNMSNYSDDVITTLNKKTDMKWSNDTSYKGAGFCVKTDMSSFAKHIQKLIK